MTTPPASALPPSLLLLQQRAELLKIVTESVLLAAEGFSGRKLKAGPPQFGSVNRQPLTEAGMIRYEGGMFSLELLLGLNGQLTNAEDSLAPPAPDVTAEMLNVAFGTIDPQMRGQGIVLKSSFPFPVDGKKLEHICKITKVPSIAVALYAADLTLYLEIFPGGTFLQPWKYTE